MRFVFLQNFDPKIAKYTTNNLPLQELSKSYPTIFIASGDGSCLNKFYHKPIIVSSKANYQLDKLNLAIKFFSNFDNYDIIIRTCIDAVIMDFGMLKKIVEEEVDPLKPILMGNRQCQNAPDNKTNARIKWIRGGCQLWTKPMVHQLKGNTIKYKRNNDWDMPLTYEVKKRDVTIINRALFELNDKWTGVAPVWHPKSNKFTNFMGNIRGGR